MTVPSILILGGRGRFGLAAARAFAQSGWQVVAQVRPGTALDALPALAQVRWLPWDLQDTAGLARAAGPVAALVHAVNPSSYANRRWQQEAPAFMDAAIALACRLEALLMFPGNVYNYGRAMPERLCEDTPQRADTPKGRLRVALERQLEEATQSRGLRAVVVRAGDFFGAGRGSWFDRVLVKDLARGRLVLPDGTDTATAWAYLPDLARCFVQLAGQRHRLAGFNTFHFAGHTMTGSDWQQLLGPLLAGTAHPRPLRTRSLPWWLLRLLSPLNPEWAGLLEMRYLWRRPHRLDGGKLSSFLGALPHTPIAVATANALRELDLLPHAPARAPGAPPALVVVQG